MKYIILDTNIFYKNWYLDSKDFEILQHHINTTQDELLISKLVCEETNNKFNEIFIECNKNIQNKINDINKLTRENLELSLHNVYSYDFTTILNKKFAPLYFGYSKVSHNKIISKIFKKEKPIKNKDIGYRDTLIWLSFIDSIPSIKEGVDEFIFISKNHHDFFIKKENSYHLHPDLLEDLKDEKISVYTDLKSFIDTHSISTPFKELKNEQFELFQEKYLYSIEEIIDYEITEYFEDIPYSIIKQALNKKFSIDTYILSNMFNFRIEIMDGIEDPQINKVRYLDNQNNKLVDYQLWVRNCSIFFDIPDKYCPLIEDSIPYLVDIGSDEDTTTYILPTDICLKMEIFCDVTRESLSSFDVVEINLEKYC